MGILLVHPRHQSYVQMSAGKKVISSLVLHRAFALKFFFQQQQFLCNICSPFHVGGDQGSVSVHRLPLRELLDLGQNERRVASTSNAKNFSFGDGLFDDGINLLFRNRCRTWDGICETDAGGKSQCILSICSKLASSHTSFGGKEKQRTDHRSSLFLVLNNRRTLDATFSRPERREVHRAGPTIGKGSNSNTLGLEILKGSGNIQKAFTTAADNSNRSPSKLGEVCGDVHRVLTATVNTSQTASAKDLDPCEVSEDHGASYCGATSKLALVRAQESLLHVRWP